MEYSKKALTLFKSFDCSQAVFAAFHDEFDLDEATCLKLSSGFGGGMSCGETCGAVTGAYLVLGMLFGNSTGRAESKAVIREAVREFNSQFIPEQGSLLCKELLGVNISHEEGKRYAREQKLFVTQCPKFVETACLILERQLAEMKKGA